MTFSFTWTLRNHCRDTSWSQGIGRPKEKKRNRGKVGWYWSQDTNSIDWFLFSRSVMSSSLQPKDCSTPVFPVLHHLPQLQHARLPCPSPSVRVYSNSCPLSWWWHPSISSSVTPFFSYLQSFPALGPFLMIWLFTSGGKSIWSFSISSSNEYSGLNSFRIDWFDLLSVQGNFKSFLQHHSSKASILQCSAYFIVHE